MVLHPHRVFPPFVLAIARTIVLGPGRRDCSPARPRAAARNGAAAVTPAYALLPANHPAIPTAPFPLPAARHASATRTRALPRTVADRPVAELVHRHLDQHRAHVHLAAEQPLHELLPEVGAGAGVGGAEGRHRQRALQQVWCWEGLGSGHSGRNPAAGCATAPRPGGPRMRMAR